MPKNLSDLAFCIIISLIVAGACTVWSGDLFLPKKEVSFNLCVVSDDAEPKQVMVYPKAGDYFKARFKPTMTSQGNLPCILVKADIPTDAATSMMVMSYGKSKIEEIRIFTPEATNPVVVHDGVYKGRFIWNILPASESRTTIVVHPAAARTASR